MEEQRRSKENDCGYGEEETIYSEKAREKGFEIRKRVLP
jgi:hypothetical protein